MSTGKQQHVKSEKAIKTTPQVARWRDENSFATVITPNNKGGSSHLFSPTAFLSFKKTPAELKSYCSFTHTLRQTHTHTHFTLSLYLDVTRSKPAGVLLAAQGQNVEIHQHSKVPTL